MLCSVQCAPCLTLTVVAVYSAIIMFIISRNMEMLSMEIAPKMNVEWNSIVSDANIVGNEDVSINERQTK